MGLPATLTDTMNAARRLWWGAQYTSRWPLYEWIYYRYRHFTMIPREKFITNLDICTRFAPRAGCIVECGVWRGGMSAGMADALPGREHFLFDSFEGLPPVQAIDGPAAIAYQSNISDPKYFDNCRAERSFAERCMKMSKARKFHLRQGWFSETVRDFLAPEPIAVLRLDGDWYESTTQCLVGLYPHVVAGGLVIIDDYYTWDGCARAVHDFLSTSKSTARLRENRLLPYFIKPPMD